MAPKKLQEVTDANIQIESNPSVRQDLLVLHDEVEKTAKTQQELKVVQKGIIEDALRNTKMTPEQINSNANLLKTLGVGTAVFFGLRRLWKGSGADDKTNFGTRAAMLLGTLIGGNMLSQALTGKSGGKLIKDIVSGDVSLSDVMNGKTALPESRWGNVEVTSGVLRDIPYPILAQYTTRGDDDMPRVDISKLHEGLSVVYSQETDVSKKTQLGQKLQMLKWLLDERDGSTYMNKTLQDMGITKTILDSGNKSDNLNALLDGWKQRETDISVYEKVNNMILKDKKDPTVLAYLQANKPSLQDLITRNYFAAQALPTSPTTPSLPKDKETDVVVTSPEKTIVSDTKITAPANVEKIEDANAVTVIDTPATKKPTTETTTPVVVDTPVKVETPVVVTSPEKTLTDADKILKRNAEGVNVLQKHNLALIADKTDLPYLDKTTSHMDIRGKGWYALSAHGEEVYMKGVRTSGGEVVWGISMPHNKGQLIAPVQSASIEDALTLAHLSAYIQHLNHQGQKPEYIKEQLEKGLQTLPDGVDKKLYTDWTLSIDK